jgi:branched-chain amino acid transport system substrate-binding protein
MALAPSPAAEAWRDSGLARTLKAGLALLAILSMAVLLSACTGMGNGPDRRGEPGGRPGTHGAGGRMVRPDVNPIGPDGPAAYGSPRGPGGAGTGSLRIAILIPQSGANKPLGDNFLLAAQMAVFDSGRSGLELIIKNTANGASNAAQSAINEGAEVIIGPVFSGEVASVRAVAAPYGVPVFTLSTDTSVAGGGVYLMSFPMEEEIRAVVNYAASRGMGLFAVMSPQTGYANRATSAFQRDVNAIGGQVVASAAYAPGSPSYGSVMQLDGKDFDALFIPASGREGLRSIAGLIRFGPPPPAAPKPLTEEQIAAGVAPPPPPATVTRAVIPDHILIGTGSWYETENGSSGALARGVFAGPDPSAVASFRNRFQGIYEGRQPTVGASNAYDAVRLAATLGSAEPGQRFTQSAITDPNGFDGVTGIFRFRSNGTIERGLAVLEVTGSGFGVVSSAPRSFQGLGS